MYSTENGQRELSEKAGFKRLILASMNRGHVYESIDSIKEELSKKVMDLAPPSLPKGTKVPFLTAGEDIGYRKVHFDGTTELSGMVIIQDVQKNDETYTRQMIFQSMKKHIQSEARIVNDPKKKKKKNKIRVVDQSYLLWEVYHAMLVGWSLLPQLDINNEDKRLDVLLIGVGGGSLPSFVSKTFEKKVHMTCLELDGEVLEIAKTWFALEENENVKYITADGLDFMRDEVEKSMTQTYDVIIFDVGSIEHGLVVVPPKQFTSEETLKHTKSLLKKSGVLLINVNLEDTNRRKVIGNTKKHYDNIHCFDLPDSNSKVLACMDNKFDFESASTKTKDLQKFAIAKHCGKFNNDNFDLVSILDYLIKE